MVALRPHLLVLGAALLGGLVALLIAGLPGFAQDEEEPSAQPDLQRWVPLYANGLGSLTGLRQMHFHQGDRRCARRAATRSMGILVRSRSASCAWRTPVLGRRLDMAVSVMTSRRTDRRVVRRTGMGIVLRGDGRGGEYRFIVVPNLRGYILDKAVATQDGVQRFVLARGQDRRIRGTNRPNRLRLRVDGSQIVAWVGSSVIAVANDPAPRQLGGRVAAVGMFSMTRSHISGAQGLVSGIRIQVADPRRG